MKATPTTAKINYQKDSLNKKNNMEKSNVVSIWLGKFQNKNEFDAYLVVDYSSDDEVTSVFSKSYKLGFVDNQFFEAEFCNTNDDLKSVIGELSYAEQFSKKINVTKEYDSVIAVYDYEYVGNKKSDETTVYIGSFEYEDE